MNKDIFRLVFSGVLNMYVPVSEAAKSRAGERSKKRTRSLTQNVFVIALVTSAPIAWADSVADSALISSQGGSIVDRTINSLTYRQVAPKSIADWSQLGTRAGELLKFDQQGNRNWSVLNRIHSLNASRFDGMLQADGNVFLINTNGVIFGNGSQTNIGGSLYAGSLDITDDLFNRGLLSDPANPVFSATGGFVMVEGGAKIYAESGGRVVLLAPTVTNNGLIETPDGQTILAAGQKVYLQALTTGDVARPQFTGENAAHLLVEVDSGGTATNLGQIIADRGNITMVGLAVNQDGLVSASTSVRANGSVKLLARDTVSADPIATAFEYRATNGGKVTLGKNSVTEVRVEVADKEEITGAQLKAIPFDKSKITIAGSNVEVQGKIIAKGGDVEIANRLQTSPITMQRIYLGENSVIDVSGVDAVAPMSRNQLEIQLFSDQLKDVPLLRDSDLFRQTVFVDRRKGTSLTDITPFVDLKGQTVAELMTSGGSVAFSGETIQRKGSVIDVSGGTTTYLPGTINETTLSFNGVNIPISEIDANTTIPTVSDVYAVTSEKWGVTRSWDLTGSGTKNWGKAQTISDAKQFTTRGSTQAGYIEGNDAGEIRTANSFLGQVQDLPVFAVSEGTLLARTTIGTEQRLTQQVPLGGKISLAGNFVSQPDASESLDNLNLYENGFNFDTALKPANGLRDQNIAFLNNGFNRVRLAGEVNSTLNVNPNGSVTIDSLSVGNTTVGAVNADVIANGSNINIEVNIADGVKVSSAGTFTNDTPGVIGAQTQAVAMNAGSINVGDQNNDVVIGKNVTLDASAGAWVDNQRQLHQGNAGDISIRTVQDGIGAGSQFKAYGFDKGGNLSIEVLAGGINIAAAPKDNALNLAPSFFQQGGFSHYNLSATSSTGEITVGDGSAQDVYTNMQTLRMNPGFTSLTSGNSVLAAASPWLAPATQRQASSITLKNTDLNQTLTINENATIRTDVGGKVNLETQTKMVVLGDIVTPAGEINLKLKGDQRLPYNPSNSIFIGENANLTATGVYRQQPNNRGLIAGEVLNGGKINVLTRDEDTSIGAIVIKEGAILDVSAAAGVTDRQFTTGFQRETLHGDAGSITLTARDGLIIDGDLKGNASGTGRGGTLSLSTESAPFDPTVDVHPQVGTDFTITQNKQLLAQGLNAGDPILPVTSNPAEIIATKGKAQISVDQIKQGGFDNVAIQNSFGNTISVDAGVDLVVPGTLTLQARQLSVEGGGNASVSAHYIALNEFKERGPTSASLTEVVNLGRAPGAITAADNSLTINAKQIGIKGEVEVTNVNSTVLNAELDINGSGRRSPDKTVTGSLTAPEKITLSARQIYPNTANKLKFEAVGDDSQIIVNQSGQAATPVLSAQGELTLKADHIEQNGTLKAPFGVINLEAAKSISLGDGSLTSVSGEGQLIPFATTRLSGQGYQVNINKGDGTSQDPILTAKSINLQSDSIEQKQGAVIDVSGGGDMFAFEFIPGIGGSTDILAQPGYFAVMPSIGTDFAPIDSVYQRSSATVNVGDAVYLSGIQGLATGTYTLLPARYALMPGAFLVKANVKSDLLPNQTAKQIDGTTLTTGYLTALGTGARDANWSTFKVVSGDILRPAPGTVSQSPAEYLITSANTFFSNEIAQTGVQQQLPKDAGRIAFDAGSQLSLAGNIVTNKPADARGALVDIASDNIRVVSTKDNATGALQLSTDDLNQLGAESVLLGGLRDINGNTTKIRTTSKTVAIENSADKALVVPEFIATATDSVTVKSGATIDAKTDNNKTGISNIETNGDGALLAVSAVNDINYSRTGGSQNPSLGTLNIEAGANINAAKSVVLDATKDNTLVGTVKVADGGSATFGANRILLGNPSPAELGLVVNNETLANLGDLGKFSLSSQNNLDVYGTVDFGNENLDLTINAAGIAGFVSADDKVNISARNFEIKNNNDASFITPTETANGTLDITAANVKLSGKEVSDTSINSGKTTIAGFAEVNVNTNELRATKSGSTTFDVEQTTINAGRITADTGADFAIRSSKTLTTATLASPIATTNTSIAADGIGGKLQIEADKLTIASDIALASGNLSLIAEQDLDLDAGAIVSAQSTEVTFYDKAVATPGGTVSLQSKTGNVNVNAGAVIDVSAVKEADAGTVSITATNTGATVNIAGDIKGTDAQGNTSGRLVLDVDKLGNLSATNKQASGFGDSREYRVRNEANVTIAGAGADALKAKEVVVTVDKGAITVTGEVDASGNRDGRILLAARDDVTLSSGSFLKANSTRAEADGGKVEISTLSGNLNLEAGSTIAVNGGTGGQGGDVRLRAPRNIANTDININTLNTNFVGAKSIQAEGFKAYDATTLSATSFANNGVFMTEAASFMTSVYGGGGVGMNRLSPNDPNFAIVSGIEVNSATNLTLSNDTSLFNLRFDPTTGASVDNTVDGLNAEGKPLLAGVLTLRAQDNLNINGTLSDGFTTANLTSGTVQGLNSWSYNLVAGADVTSANTLAVKAASTDSGNLTLANAKGIRTGTGDINIATSGDLTLGNNSSVIYTAGHETELLAGFDAPAASFRPLYLTNGGDINLQVQGNIVGRESTGRQLINNWLFRQGGGTSATLAQPKDTSWWVRPDLFRQSLATFGGGDVNIRAGGSISDFSASLATTGQYDSNGNTSNSRVDGGGDLTIRAGGDIVNGTYFVARGEGSIASDGSIRKVGNGFGTVLAMQEGDFKVTAAKDVLIESVMNPTLFSPSTANVPGQSAINDLGDGNLFNTYGVDSQVNVSSLVGDVSLRGVKDIINSRVSGLNNSAVFLSDTVTGYYPGSVSATAFGGNVSLTNANLLPSPTGNLSLLAANNVTAGNINMSDADLNIFPNPLNTTRKFGNNQAEINQLAGTPVHSQNRAPVMIVAQNGSVFKEGELNGIINLPKAAKIVAGQNIEELNINIQNLNPEDVTLIKAGRDIIGGANSASGITIAGPGEVLVEAGRDIDLGASSGINTIGNNKNPALPVDSASITLAAGLGEGDVALDAYISEYILPTGAGPTVLQGDSLALTEYREGTAQALTSFIRKIKGDNTISDADALIAFNALPREAKTIFAYRHFSSELLATGKNFAKTQSYERGDNAIATLFSETDSTGDITLFNSKISTGTNGDIDILAPHGLINAGLAGGSSNADIGILTQQFGAIRAYSDTGFLVNQSKVVTQLSGDITVWANQGDIDAGRGSKSATSIPQRIVNTDVDGNTTVRILGVAAGSGIRAQSFDPDGPNGPLVEPAKGSVALIAPRGSVNAGEAGIEAGDFLAVAIQVLGADNISVTGVSQGVPAAATGAIGAGVGISPDATNAAIQDVANNVIPEQPIIDSIFPSLISVEILGFGN